MCDVRYGMRNEGAPARLISFASHISYPVSRVAYPVSRTRNSELGTARFARRFHRADGGFGHRVCRRDLQAAFGENLLAEIDVRSLETDDERYGKAEFA